MNTRKTKCLACGGNLSVENLKGTVMPWKEFPFVEINTDFEIPRCVECGEEFLNSSEMKVLDGLIETSIRDKTSAFILMIKEKVRLSQKIIAKKIGLTEVYLSELIGKKKTPSYQVFNLLKIIANHNEALDDLNCFQGLCSQFSVSLEDNRMVSKFHYMRLEEITVLTSESNRAFDYIFSDNSGRLH